MALPFWTLLDAGQIGALLALGLLFLLGALYRRDVILAWLTGACWILALRELVGLLLAQGPLDPDQAERVGMALGILGAAMVGEALRRLFGSRHTARVGLLVWCTALPAILLEALPLLPQDLLQIARLLMLLGATATALEVLRVTLILHAEGNRETRRLLWGLGACFSLLVSGLVSQRLFRVDLHQESFALGLLTLFVGGARTWAMSQELRRRLRETQDDAVAWREMMPGPTFRAGEASREMTIRFGEHWATRLQPRMLGFDGHVYRIHTTSLGDGAVGGWVEVLDNSMEDLETAFLRGWRIGLGFDEGEERHRVQLWLESWGAEVVPWGTVPPREGPFPSLLIWGREPSILHVWREYDVTRRKCRWVQVGGIDLEGPHVRLERPLTQRTLWEALQGLLNLRDQEGGRILPPGTEGGSTPWERLGR